MGMIYSISAYERIYVYMLDMDFIQIYIHHREIKEKILCPKTLNSSQWY